jgi:rubrerythrin
MNIYQFAMQMEQDGENFYRRLAKEATVPGLAKIFTMLADEEVKHYKVIVLLSKKEKNPESTNTALLENVKNVFIGMRTEKKQLSIDTPSAIASYSKACTIEAESEKFYREKSAQTADEYEQQIFSRLAGEEANHFRIMKNILEFVSRTEPGNWLENAEWYHLDEY